VSSKTFWQGFLKYGLAILLLSFVVSMNWTALKQLFSRQPVLRPFLEASAAMVAVILLQYLRWFILVRSIDLPFTLYSAARLGLVGTFYNTFLPGSIGGDFVKAYMIAKGNPERRAAAVSTVIADRLLGLFGLLLYAAVAGGIGWMLADPRIVGKRSLETIILVCLGLVLLMGLGYLVLGFLPGRWLDGLGNRIVGLPKVGKTLVEVWQTVRRYRARPFTILGCVLISALAHTGMMFAYHWAVQVFPPENLALQGELAEHFIIAPIGFIAQALIPVPGGLGASELTFGGLYQLIRGREAEAVGLAGRLALRVIEWVLGLCGFVAYLAMKHELPVGDDASATPAEPRSPTAEPEFSHGSSSPG